MTTPNITPLTRYRLLFTLFSAQSLFSAAFIAMFTLGPLIAIDLSGRVSAAGWPQACVLLGRAASAYPFGLVMDRWGRRWGLTFAYTIGTAGAAAAALAVINQSFLGFLLGSLAIGLARGATDQSRFAAAEIHTAERQARAIGFITFAGTIGAILGPRIVPPSEAFALSRQIPGEAGPIIIAAIFLAVAALLLALGLHPDPLHIGRALAAQYPAKTTNTNPETLKLTDLSPANKRTALIGSGTMIIAQLVMTVIMVITSVYMRNNGHDTTAISYVIMAHTLGMFGLSSLTSRLINWQGSYRIILTGIAILISACLLTPLSTTFLSIAVALFLLGLGWNFCYVAGSELFFSALPVNSRGRGQGLNEIFVSLASLGGTLSTGVIFSLGGIQAVAFTSFLVTITLLIFTIFYRPKGILHATAH
ncbi:MAG TPA: MFS transporter [Anaerolineae bacterium]|nr:MFS transporter [Anaerolineae bacterium]